MLIGSTNLLKSTYHTIHFHNYNHATVQTVRIVAPAHYGYHSFEVFNLCKLDSGVAVGFKLCGGTINNSSNSGATLYTFLQMERAMMQPQNAGFSNFIPVHFQFKFPCTTKPI